MEAKRASLARVVIFSPFAVSDIPMRIATLSGLPVNLRASSADRFRVWFAQSNACGLYRSKYQIKPGNTVFLLQVGSQRCVTFSGMVSGKGP
jgi:hypothetical protein